MDQTWGWQENDQLVLAHLDEAEVCSLSLFISAKLFLRKKVRYPQDELMDKLLYKRPTTGCLCRGPEEKVQYYTIFSIYFGKGHAWFYSFIVYTISQIRLDRGVWKWYPDSRCIETLFWAKFLKINNSIVTISKLIEQVVHTCKNTGEFCRVSFSWKRQLSALTIAGSCCQDETRMFMQA